ncbi:MAG: RDD family protein, partial [Pseudomonadota bacterium]
ARRRFRLRRRGTRRASRAPQPRRLLTDYLPPEGVPVRFEVAGLGARLGAQMLDILLTGALIAALIIFLAVTEIVSGTTWFALAALLFFFVRVPYYVLAELLWNGQTLGKRIVGLRVISADGRTLSPHAVTVRNLMKEMEVFAPGTALLAAAQWGLFWSLVLLAWIAILLAVPLLNRRRQRLGDIIAGTYVVEIPKAALLPDLTAAAAAVPEERFAFQAHHLDHYGRYELQTLERLLRVDPAGLREPRARERQATTLAEVAGAVTNRIGWEERLKPEEHWAFLNAFYTAQRAYLENRKLFGDAREDKFHADAN